MFGIMVLARVRMYIHVGKVSWHGTRKNYTSYCSLDRASGKAASFLKMLIMPVPTLP